jgi:hypothetical protein
MIALSFTYWHDLPFCLFMQSWLFVVFNKVVTAQVNIPSFIHIQPRVIFHFSFLVMLLSLFFVIDIVFHMVYLIITISITIYEMAIGAIWYINGSDLDGI